ncbi:MAG: ATP-dependent Clp protease ATP-binding subunit [Thermoguttaceae bacterium]|nr:ATP-dependent Clp protease ATP-binding subunit [Thermoguttaceae bacterium]
MQTDWMTELDKQLRRGKHVLLYGNVEDRYELNNRYDPLDKCLDSYFLDRGYFSIIHYDIAEKGRVFPETAKNVFRTCDSVDQIRRHLIDQDENPVVAVFEYTDRMSGNPQQQTTEERKELILLKKTFTQARRIKPEKLKEKSELSLEELSGRRNAMIFVASSLQALPSWFYQDHPSLALIRIPRPETQQRETFINRFFDKFAVDGLSESDQKAIRQTFIDNTEDLTISDMISIARTAQSEHRFCKNVQEMKDLIFYYRYGAMDDPWEKFNREKIRDAYTEISKRVIGQDNAVSRIVNMLKLANVGITMSPSSGSGGGKPKGVFFFVGPTGVGKTELAKALAQQIFGDENRMHRFDMSEYAEKHAAEKLTGSPPGYVGYEEGGQLTNYVRENPFSILLFDEIEKANGAVLDKFLQILEDGRLTDGKGLTVYFNQSIIIFTSNIGAESLLNIKGMDNVSDESPAYEDVRRHFYTEVQNHFVKGLGRPEIFNRLGNNILGFDLLRPMHIKGIFKKFMRNLEKSAGSHKFKLTYKTADGTITDKPEESTLCQWIIEIMKQRGNLLYGGRRIRVQMEENIEQPLAAWVFDNAPAEGSTLTLDIKNGKLEIEN